MNKIAARLVVCASTRRRSRTASLVVSSRGRVVGSDDDVQIGGEPEPSQGLGAEVLLGSVDLDHSAGRRGAAGNAGERLDQRVPNVAPAHPRPS